MRIFLVWLCTLSALTAVCQPYAGADAPTIAPTRAAGCTPPSTTTYLEMNNVRAMVHTAGNLWQVPGQNLSQYEVPKNSGIMALFTAALWLGGVDANNQLKLAALRYRDGQDYWTGPLTQGEAETSYDNCFKYDHHFITVQDDIREFDARFQAGLDDAANGTNTQSELYPNYQVPLSIKDWPAHGDVSIGQDYYLAPFYDRNEDGQYRWEDGDYPFHDIHKTKDCNNDRRVLLYGDINFWWVMNDKGNIHTETGADPIGMEIRAQAFSFSSNDEINNMTFYNYELINRGTQTLYDTYFGSFTDGALGDPFDDYVGCDVNRGLGFYYNGDNFDGDNNGFFGYGANPPAVGVDFFEGPYQDNDGVDNAFGIGEGEALNGIGFGDGIIDNERFGMRRFLYYSNTTNGANPNQTDPIFATHYYQYLRGYWKDGTKFFYGGSGHLSDPEANQAVPCDFMFPGDSDPLGWGTDGLPQPPWTEQTAGNVPNDRRFVQSAGPFILKPGAVNNITVGVVWAQAPGGGPFASVEYLKRADDKAQALFENCFKVLDAPHAPDLSFQELENQLILTISNPLNSNNYLEQYTEFDPFIVAEDPNADRYYRFQGYQIFQLIDESVSSSDLQDVTKARLVAQCDVKDGVGRLINFEYDDIVGTSIPTEMVNGEDKGIRHSFLVTEDLFATGNKKLVNFKRYYYMAIAYAYNNYKTYDPDDPNALDGQKRLYLPSRKAAYGEIKAIECIPHNPSPEADGTISSIAYGKGPEITRLDGFGNGGRMLELTGSSKDFILQNGYMDKPVYEGGKGPLNVKVIDPLNVVDGYFECAFQDYSPSARNGADTARWVINRYTEEGGELIESVSSDMLISRDNEQLIPQWGISVQVHQELYYLPEGATGGSEVLTTDLLDASLTYADSSKRWLSGVADQNGFYPTNWIRSGEYDPTVPDDCSPTGAGYVDYFDPCNYSDEVAPFMDVNKDWSGILGGTIAPHRLTGYQSSFMPMAYYDYSGFLVARRAASLSFLPSVEIVLTPDKSKWTRCPVIELGREPALNAGGAEAGQLRKSPSVDVNGNPDGSGTTGLGWFPGYAIDVESGARLYLAFGENSFLVTDNGADMLWNPTDRLTDVNGGPIMGGMHPIYVMSYGNKSKNSYLHSYDYPAYIPSVASSAAGNVMYQDLVQIEAGVSAAKKNFYGSITWIAYPLRASGQNLLSNEATIKLRVNKEYKNFSSVESPLGGPNQGKPMYGWNMDEIVSQTGSADMLTSVLDLINVVPNPYNAYSEYERNRLDTRIKITNLPERCKIKIYNSQGKLIKSFDKDSPDTYLDWLLINHKGIPVASGVYLIHIEVPDIGEVVLKSFITMRQVDLQNI